MAAVELSQQDCDQRSTQTRTRHTSITFIVSSSYETNVGKGYFKEGFLFYYFLQPKYHHYDQNPHQSPPRDIILLSYVVIR